MAIAYIELAYNECSHTADLRWPHRQAAHSHCRYTPSVSVIFGWPSFPQFQKHLFFACCSWWISAYLGCYVFHLTHVVVIILENSGLDQLTFPSSLWTAWGEICIHFSHAFLQNLLPEGCPQTTHELSRTGQSKRPSARMGSRILLWLAFTYRTTYRCKRMYDCCA